MKKTIAILIATLMLLTLIPVGAFATEVACPGHGAEHTKDNCQYTLYNEVPSKCGELGYNVYSCDGCGDYFAADFTRIEGKHNYELSVEAVDPTCTEKGSKEKWVCSDCGKVDPDRNGKAVAALGHDWEIVSSTGNCLEGGVLTEACSRCDATRVTPITGTGEGHTFGQYPVDYEAPSCNAEGWAKFECEECGETKTVTIEKLGHTVVTDAAVAPTCTETGLTEGSHCSVCGEVIVAQDVVDALDHDIVKSNIVGATCTEKGSFTLSCTRCDYEEDFVDEALGHSYGDWEIIKEASCASKNGEGLKQRVCDVCGEVEMEKIPAVDHTYDHEPTEIIPATCNTWGLKLYYCVDCGYLKDPEDADRIRPLGHTTYDDALTVVKSEVPETCEANGLRTWNCGRCGVAQESVVDKISGHTEATFTVAANCHMYSYIVTYCTNDCCNLAVLSTVEVDGVTYDVELDGNPVRFISIEVGNEFDMTKHDAVVENTNEPTCDVPGSNVCYCPYCDYYYLERIEALGHDFDATIAANVTELIPATCTNNQWVTVKCSRCDATESVEIADSALAHALIEIPMKDSTCTELGYKSYFDCERCDYTIGYEEIPMKDHVYTSAVVDPTCSTIGYTIHLCACGDIYVDNEVLYVYDPVYEYATFEDAKKVHPGLDEATKETFREGNCNYTSLEAYDCADCGKTIHVVSDPSTGHHIQGNLVNAGQAPTCTAAGWTAIYECERCGAKLGGTEIPALGHTEVTDAAVAPTCTETGLTEGSHCSVCGETIVAQDVVPALGHTWVDADCENAKTCSVCGATEGAALGHDWADADCTTAKTCKVCGETDGAPLGHRYLTPAYTYTADCTHVGFIYWSCSYCDDDSVDYISNFVAALGHNYVDVVEKDSTCCEEGHTAGSQCSRCDDWATETTIIPKKDYHWNGEEVLKNECTNDVDDRFCVWCEQTIGQDHTNLFEIEIAPDCNSEGYTLSLCDADGCGYEAVGNYKPMRDEHLWSAWETILEPTYTSTGLEIRYCICCAAEGIEVVEENILPAKAGVLMYLDAENADAPGAGFTDSSLVALTISLDSVETNVWGTTFRVNHSANLEYVDCDYHAADVFENYNVFENEDGNFVSITAAVPNVDDEHVGEVTIEGDMPFITLYFRVVNGEIEGKNTTAEFSVSNIEMLDKDYNVKTVVAETESIIIDKFMDANGDGFVGLADILFGNKIITGENGDIAYDVTIDVDKDGEITAYDLYQILLYVNGAIAYEDVIGA